MDRDIQVGDRIYLAGMTLEVSKVCYEDHGLFVEVGSRATWISFFDLIELD